MTCAIFPHHLIVIFLSSCYFLVKRESASIIIKFGTTTKLAYTDQRWHYYYYPLQPNMFKCKHARIAICCNKAPRKIVWVNITRIMYVKNITNSNGTSTSKHYIIIWVCKNNSDFYMHILNKRKIAASSKITRENSKNRKKVAQQDGRKESFNS